MKIENIKNSVICGDCLEVMKEMPGGSFDLVITDPPYNLKKDFGDTYNDNKPWPEYWKLYEKWFSEIFRISSSKSRLYVSCIPSQMWTIKPLLEKIGFTYCQFIVWHHRNCFLAGKCSKQRIGQPWTKTFEIILLFKKGKPPKMLSCPTELTFDVIMAASPQTNYKFNTRVHPTQKPLKLWRSLIMRTPGDIILDCFFGSGVTGVASKQLGRDYVGIEISKNSCKIAEAMIKVAKYIPVLPMVKQKGLFR